MREEDKILNLLGLAQRAGRIASGGYMVEKTVKEKRAVLVIIAGDASDNTKKKFHNMCSFYRVPVVELSTMASLGGSIGREERSSLALTDEGFSKAVLKAFDAYRTRR